MRQSWLVIDPKGFTVVCTSTRGSGHYNDVAGPEKNGNGLDVPGAPADEKDGRISETIR